MAAELLTLLVVAAATAAASFTIARTKVTAPFRAAVLARSDWFGSLVACPYCVSHYLALAGTIVFRPDVTTGPAWAGFLASWMCTVAVSAGVVGVITRAIAPAPPPAPAAGPPAWVRDRQPQPL